MMHHPQLKASLHLLLAWLILSVAGFIFGEKIVVLFLPYLGWVSDIISVSYKPSLEVISQGNTLLIHMQAVVEQPIYVHNTMTIPPGVKMTAGSNLIHTLVPLVILFSTLSAWPTTDFRQRIILLLLGLPMIFLILGLTVPFLLAGHLEIMLTEYAEKGGEVREMSLLVVWMLFNEMGGIWIIPLVSAGINFIIMRRIHSILWANPCHKCSAQ